MTAASEKLLEIRGSRVVPEVSWDWKSHPCKRQRAHVRCVLGLTCAVTGWQRRGPGGDRLMTATSRTVASERGPHSEKLQWTMVKNMNFFKGPGFRSLLWTSGVIFLGLGPHAYQIGMRLPVSVAHCKD